MKHTWKQARWLSINILARHHKPRELNSQLGWLGVNSSNVVTNLLMCGLRQLAEIHKGGDQFFVGKEEAMGPQHCEVVKIIFASRKSREE